jgi:hypothetical protein
MRSPTGVLARSAEFSQMDDSFDIKVDSVPEGFRVLESEHGCNFYSSACDIPVEP